MDGSGGNGYVRKMDDRAFLKALKEAAREQGLDPTEVLAGWDVDKGLPTELTELMARVLSEMADKPDERPD